MSPALAGKFLTTAPPGKPGSPYLFCWVREEDTGPGGWPSPEDPVPGGRGQRAGILNRGAGILCRLWLRGSKAQGNLYSLLQSDGSRLADMLFFPVPREAVTSLVVFYVVLCGLWALLLSGGRRNGRRTLFLLWFRMGGPQPCWPCLWAYSVCACQGCVKRRPYCPQASLPMH